MDRTDKKIAEKAGKPVKDYAKEIVRYYVMFHKGGTESTICHNIWQYYHRHNCERIWASENEERISRFDCLFQERQDKTEDYNLYYLFYDILSVETGLKKESREYKECMKSLFVELKKNGFLSAMPLKALLFPEKAEKNRIKAELKQRKKDAKKQSKTPDKTSD